MDKTDNNSDNNEKSKSIEIRAELYNAIEKMVDEHKYLFENEEEFVEYAIREKLIEVRCMRRDI